MTSKIAGGVEGCQGFDLAAAPPAPYFAMAVAPLPMVPSSTKALGVMTT
jgi:hypothetical protein